MTKLTATHIKRENYDTEENTCTLTPNELLLSMFNIPLSSSGSTQTANIIEEQIDTNLPYKNEDVNYMNGIVPEKQDIITTPMLRRHGLFNNYSPLSTINPSLADALSTLKAKSPAINTRNMQFVSSPRSGSTRAPENPGSQSIELSRIPGSIPTENNCGQLPGKHNKSPENSQSVSHVVFNGQATEVPDEILCHLCQFPMKICFRKSKYKSEIREYPAYRCLRKGCQTFRAIRKVIDPNPVNRLPPNRKRKTTVPPADEKYSCSSQVGKPVLNEPPVVSREEPKQTLGTLIYVPAVMTQSQILKVQEAAMKIVLDTVGNISTPMVVPSPFTYERIKENLETNDGIKIIQKLFMETAANNNNQMNHISNETVSPLQTNNGCINNKPNNSLSSSPYAIQPPQPTISRPPLEPDSNDSSSTVNSIFSNIYSVNQPLQYNNSQPILDMELNFDNFDDSGFDDFDTQ